MFLKTFDSCQHFKIGKFHRKLPISNLAQKGRRSNNPKPVPSPAAEQQLSARGSRTSWIAAVSTTPSCVTPGLSPLWCLPGALTHLFFPSLAYCTFSLGWNLSYITYVGSAWHIMSIFYFLYDTLWGVKPSISSAYNFLFSKLTLYLKCSPLSAFKSFLKYIFFQGCLLWPPYLKLGISSWTLLSLNLTCFTIFCSIYCHLGDSVSLFYLCIW